MQTKDDRKQHYSGNIFENEDHVVNHLKESFALALEDKSKLSDGSFLSCSILNYFGMSGRKTRHMLNNICSIPGIRYGEVGTFKGSTLFSSMYRNDLDAVCCDNWSQFNGEQAQVEFMWNLRIFSQAMSNKQSLGIFNVDFREETVTDSRNWKNLDFFFFDGPHDEKSQYEGIAKNTNNFSDLFILMVDDWHWDGPRNGTLKAIKDCNIEVLHRIEVDVEPEKMNEKNHVINRFQKSDFHNGIALFACKMRNRLTVGKR